jgi:hypothetical protein
VSAWIACAAARLVATSRTTSVALSSTSPATRPPRFEACPVVDIHTSRSASAETAMIGRGLNGVAEPWSTDAAGIGSSRKRRAARKTTRFTSTASTMFQLRPVYCVE